MNEEPLGLRVLVEVGLSYVEGIFPNINTTLYDQLGQVMDTYLRGFTSFEMAQQYFLTMLGRIDPLIHIRDIAMLRDNPIPSTESDDGDSGDESHNRKKTRTWTNYEDERLLAGIFRFGLDNWTRVAQFVGNNRTRAQCSQRWSRGLNPRICKKHWSPEEDAQLISLVQTYGEKAWTKISSCLGNRSDVQCRYHYRQITREGQPRPTYLGLGKANSTFSIPIAISANQMPLTTTQRPMATTFNQSQLNIAPKKRTLPPGMGYLKLSHQKLAPSLSLSATVLHSHISQTPEPSDDSRASDQQPEEPQQPQQQPQHAADTNTITYPLNKDLDSFLLHFK